MVLYKVPFCTDNILLASIDNRPFVPIRGICENIGINAGCQQRRIQRHVDRSHLKARRVDDGGDPTWAVALEDLSWFLRTLRPRDETALLKLERYRDSLALTLLWTWTEMNQSYSRQREVRRTISEVHKIPTPAPPRRTTKMTSGDIDKMRRLKVAGHSLREISETVGYSKTTVSQCLNGIYPGMPV